MKQTQVEFVTIPERQAFRVHCPFEDCQHIWNYTGYKKYGWIGCPACKRSVKLGDYPNPNPKGNEVTKSR